MKQNCINHIAFVLDASTSMAHLTQQVVAVADDQIAYLARRSKELDQETRITVYVFADQVECLIYDMDVLRLPSIRDFYKPNGNTALIDAAIQSQQDLAKTATLYGDHSFLTFIVTDGEENRSRNQSRVLTQLLNGQKDSWTVAVLVPNQRAKFEAKRFGFPADNIAIWDATSKSGMAEAGETIRMATDHYMTARATGTFRGTRSLFSMGTGTLNVTSVKVNLAELPASRYRLLKVDKPYPIREWVEERGLKYRLGSGYYQLTKTELIQAAKAIAVRHKASGRVYTGANARAMLGLPDAEIRVRPEYNPEYDVFVQSTSVNRKLVPGTEILILDY